MVIFSYSTLRDFFHKYPDAKDALISWYKITQKASFSTSHDVKLAFNSVDAIGHGLYVFNIRGNTYRLIVKIKFNSRTVYIRFIGTHQQYDKIDVRSLWKT
ncbi:mRNA interferase HigB [Dyadobacter sp. SG02]|uniref:type II toxin-antitoxin system HigB family toxin n=1 Tax=Dyadobacter sp. SG02 TaxID=1855291 RepID=UPI0008CA900C|nr:type II toxin-antitoxin system HigB family toxin [Dyadobacter sp. SG02]SEI80357.1 mRNA interferase HigB [Dyadobacter sp. SG02]